MAQLSASVKYLGIAMALPVDVVNGTAKLAYGKTAVEQGIIDALTTPIGTRFFLREYGSRCHELAFEPNDEVLISMMRLFISDTIGIWEKRTKFVDVEFTIIDNLIQCRIFHQILNSNEVESFVWPFYRSLKF